MKNLILLSALFIFASSCNEGNNDNNNSNQTFLEIYDGVVWINNLYDPLFPENEEVDPVYYIFLNQKIFLDAGWYDSYLECGSMDPEWSTYFASISILENLNNNFTIQDNNGETIFFSVSDDGQTMTETINGQEIQKYSRSDIPNPCN